MYTIGNEFFVPRYKLLIQVINVKFSKTGRISAQMKNFTTNEVFWTTAAKTTTACEYMHMNSKSITTDWIYNGKREHSA